MLTGAAPVAAHADGVNFKGGCGFASLNDTTPGGQLGGQDVWNGAVRIAVVANDPTATISADCILKVNGVSQGTVLTGTSAGPVSVGAGSIQFTAAVTDIVSLCAHVKATGAVNFEETVCVDATTTQVIPQPVVDLLEMVGDPLVCAVLKALAPTVNALPGGLIYIDPATGDTWIPGDPSSNDNLFWDCPPYVL
jgi:hypothetical protein